MSNTREFKPVGPHDRTDIGLAIKLATAYHEGQTYGDKDYISGHLMPVSVACRPDALYWCTDNHPAQIVAILHDILEDTKCTKATLSALFTEEIVDAVVLLTKKPNFKQSDEAKYFKAIRANAIARQVKIADMMFNLTNSVAEMNESRVEKYSRQLPMLIGA